jgi:hypothetical protein
VKERISGGGSPRWPRGAVRDGRPERASQLRRQRSCPEPLFNPI